MRVLESYPGEFDDLTEDEVHEKVEKAVHMLGGRPRGGELQLMVDLGRELADAYQERTNKLLADFADLEAAGELDLWGDEPPDWTRHQDLPETQKAPEEKRDA